MKKEEITSKLILAISELIKDEDNENFIDINKVDLNDFFHSLANIMPSYIYQKITGDNKNALEFNQLANSLCFEFLNKK